MREYIEIGASPCNEDCIQVGDENYNVTARKECAAFIEAIRKKLGKEPSGAELRIKSFPHDFGSYLEVVCYYDTNNAEAMKYAYNCEARAPLSWDEVGMNKELILTMN